MDVNSSLYSYMSVSNTTKIRSADVVREPPMLKDHGALKPVGKATADTTKKTVFAEEIADKLFREPRREHALWAYEDGSRQLEREKISRLFNLDVHV